MTDVLNVRKIHKTAIALQAVNISEETVDTYRLIGCLRIRPYNEILLDQPELFVGILQKDPERFRRVKSGKRRIKIDFNERIRFLVGIFFRSLIIKIVLGKTIPLPPIRLQKQ